MRSHPVPSHGDGVVSCHAMLCYVIRSVMLYHIMPCRYVMSCHAVSCHAMLCSCHAIPCRAMPCYVMLCYVISCYDLLCHLCTNACGELRPLPERRPLYSCITYPEVCRPELGVGSDFCFGVVSALSLVSSCSTFIGGPCIAAEAHSMVIQPLVEG